MQCLKNLELAIDAGDEAAMQRWYLPRMLDDFPKAQAAVEIARQAPDVMGVLEQLQRSIEDKHWRELVRRWDEHLVLLEHRKSAQPFVPDVTTWRGRNQAWDAVAALLAQPSIDAAALDVAWTRLVSLGGHPEAEPQRPQIEAIIRRHRAWLIFQKVQRAASEANDRRLVDTWNEGLFADWTPAERERGRVDEARERIVILTKLARQAEQAPSYPGEVALVKTAARLPADYPYDLQPRAVLADQRVAAAGVFDDAMRAPASDLAIDSAWAKLGELGAQQFVEARVAARVQLAQRRRPLITTLQQIPTDYPPEHAEDYDAQLLSTWHDELLAKCHDVDPWRPAHQQAFQRKRLLGELDAAIAAGDKPRIAQLAAEPVLERYPLPRAWGPTVKQAQEDVEAARKLLAALSQDRRSKFLELFDTRIIRENADSFQPHEEKLRQWMQTEVLPVKKLGLAPPRVQKELVWEEDLAPRCRTRWNWPSPRFTDLCVLAVCQDEPAPGDDLREKPNHVRLRIDRKSYEEGGGGRVLNVEDGWVGGYVAVAAVVDLGFEKFISEPLVLGRIDGPHQGRRNGRRGGTSP